MCIIFRLPAHPAFIRFGEKAGQTMKQWISRMRAFFLSHAYIVTLGAAITVIVSTGVYTRALRDETAAAAFGERAPTAEATPTVAPTLAPIAAHPLSTPTPVPVIPPVSGDALRGFSGDAPVYWQTLGCFQPHTALDMAAAPGEAALAYADGVVTNVTRDAAWLTSVTLACADGTQARYAGLSAACVSVGDKVTAGNPLGTLAQSIPCEAEMEAHLHIETRRDGQAIDPTQVLGVP